MKYKENLSDIKKKQYNKKQKIIKRINEMDCHIKDSKNKIYFKKRTKQLKSFKII